MTRKQLFTIFILLVFMWVLSRFDTGSLFASARQIPLWSVVLLIVLQLTTQLLVNLQWHQIAKVVGLPITFREMFYINCQGSVIDGIAPGVKIGGEITRSMQISRLVNCSGEQAAAVVVLQKLFSLSAFSALSLVAMAGTVNFVVIGVLMLFLLLILGVFMLPHKMMSSLVKGREPRFLYMKRLKRFFLTLLSQIINLKKKNVFKMFLLAALIWIIYPLKMLILTVQFSPMASLFYLGAVAFAAYLVAMINLFPGGLGGFEGTMVGLLMLMGFVQTDALVVTLLFRFTTFWFVLLFSALFVVFYKAVFQENRLQKGGSR